MQNSTAVYVTSHWYHMQSKQHPLQPQTTVYVRCTAVYAAADLALCGRKARMHDNTGA